MYNITIPKASFKSINGVIKLMNNTKGNQLFKQKDKQDLGKLINDHLSENLDKRLDADGHPMTPLSPRTPRGAANMTPLIDTGNLQRNMRMTVKGNVIRLFNETPYLIYHQEGTEKIPQRKVYPDTKDLPSPIQQLLDQFVEKRVEENIKKIFKT